MIFSSFYSQMKHLRLYDTAAHSFFNRLLLCYFAFILFNAGKQAESMRSTQRIVEWRGTRASASSMEIMFSFTIIISWIRSSSLMVISLATKPTSSPCGENEKQNKENVTHSW